jgi:arylsulfatase A-like enzyme
MKENSKTPVQKIALFMACFFRIPSILFAEDPSPKPNVLFIAVDDLRPELGAYGHEQIQSPNMDRLADEGLIFDRAYCQQAICMSSRASLLSGYRPDRYGIYQNGPLFSHVPDALTLNQHFLNNGYETVGLGKIYHHGSDLESGWTRVPARPKGDWTGRGYLDEASVRSVKEGEKKPRQDKRKGMGPAFEGPDVPDNAYADGKIAELALEELNRLKDTPFFLAVGFYKPHLPFNAPKKYWDLYDEAAIQLADNPFLPAGAPPEALTDWGELRGYHGMPKEGPMPDDLARQLIHGYYACVSYTDAQVGKLLDELDRLGLADNTIVVLWGDHGWKLGEHGMWAKHTNFERDTRVPLIIRAPGMQARGKRTAALTELVDLYPTLSELCGLPLPPHLEGMSFVSLLNDPDQPWKQAAFSQYPRDHDTLMGYSMRTNRYRYTEWRRTEDGSVNSLELYDHQVDPQENVNIATEAENQEIIAALARLLQSKYPRQP